MNRCPNCGACRECGHGGHRVSPYPYGPWWGVNPPQYVAPSFWYSGGGTVTGPNTSVTFTNTTP